MLSVCRLSLFSVIHKARYTGVGPGCLFMRRGPAVYKSLFVQEVGNRFVVKGVRNVSPVVLGDV